jgi:hypothetical protein
MHARCCESLYLVQNLIDNTYPTILGSLLKLCVIDFDLQKAHLINIRFKSNAYLWYYV